MWCAGGAEGGSTAARAGSIVLGGGVKFSRSVKFSRYVRAQVIQCGWRYTVGARCCRGEPGNMQGYADVYAANMQEYARIHKNTQMYPDIQGYAANLREYARIR